MFVPGRRVRSKRSVLILISDFFRAGNGRGAAAGGVCRSIDWVSVFGGPFETRSINIHKRASCTVIFVGVRFLLFRQRQRRRTRSTRR